MLQYLISGFTSYSIRPFLFIGGLLLLSSCGGAIPKGYHHSADQATKRAPFDPPPGYRFTKYKDKNKLAKVENAPDKSPLILKSAQELTESWMQIGLDLSFEIDREIGADSKYITLTISAKDLKTRQSLDHALRQNFTDLDYVILDAATEKFPEDLHKSGDPLYHLAFDVHAITDQYEFKPVFTADGRNKTRRLNEGGELITYESKIKTAQNLAITSIIRENPRGHYISPTEAISLVIPIFRQKTTHDLALRTK